MYALYYGDVALSAVALRAQNATNTVTVYSQRHIGLHIFNRTTCAFRTIVCYLLLAVSSRGGLLPSRGGAQVVRSLFQNLGFGSRTAAEIINCLTNHSKQNTSSLF